MKNNFTRLIIAIAIGLITQQIAGHSYTTTKYSLLIGNNKTEVPKEMYIDNNFYRFPTEQAFNSRLGMTCGIISFSVAVILMFLPSIISRKES